MNSIRPLSDAVYAADALLDAARTLIDAADRVVRQQRGDE